MWKRAKIDDSCRMKSFITATSGLLASLMLSLGFRRLAAHFDLLDRGTATNTYLKGEQTLSATACLPCRWQEV